MKAQDIREKTVEELEALSLQRRRELFDLRFKHYTGQLLDTASLRKTRRDIARVETIIRERELAQVAASAARGDR